MTATSSTTISPSSEESSTVEVLQEEVRQKQQQQQRAPAAAAADDDTLPVVSTTVRAERPENQHNNESSNGLVVPPQQPAANGGNNDFVALDTSEGDHSLQMEQEREEEAEHRETTQIPSEEQSLQQSHQQQEQRRGGWCCSLLSSILCFCCCCCCRLGSSLRKKHQMSLSRSPATPVLIRFLVPILSLLTHAVFLYGQTAHMWRLHMSVHVDAWANATAFESRRVFNTIGIPLENHVAANEEENVQQFTFMFAIQELWKAVGMPGKLLPRIAAVLLILFSGVWPHLKLFLLNITFLTANRPQQRTRVLHWLGTLGKWSLADVLAVCVMVGVLHLDWAVDPVAMKQGLIDNFSLCLEVARAMYGDAEDICSVGLAPLDCHEKQNGWDDWGKCKACVTLVDSSFRHPDTARRTFQSVLNGVDVSGDGLAYLRVQGMLGIYAFCLAVIMSILISLLVDIQDVRHNHHVRRQRQALDAEDDAATIEEEQEEVVVFQPTITATTTTMSPAEGLDINTGEENTLSTPLLLPPPPTAATTTTTTSSSDPVRRHRRRRDRRRNGRRTRRRPPPVTGGCCRSVMSYTSLLGSTGVTLAIVVAAIQYHTIGRVVNGAIPQVLEKVLGVDWDRPYSLYSLVETTGAAGGYDYLLMGTFGLFVVAGPAARALLCVIAALTNTTSTSTTTASRSSRKLLLSSIEFIGAFCAWEVFAAAVFMVNLLMPAITSTIIMKPECAEIDPDSGQCLEVEFRLEHSFALLIVGGISLLYFANTKFGSRNLSHHGNGEHETSSEAFEYSMVVQAESGDGGIVNMEENDNHGDDTSAAAPTTMASDERATLTSGIV